MAMRNRFVWISLFANIAFVVFIAYLIADYRVRNIRFSNQYVMNYSNRFININRDGYFDFTLETKEGGEAVTSSFKDSKSGVTVFIDWVNGGYHIEDGEMSLFYRDYEGFPYARYDKDKGVMYKMNDVHVDWEPIDSNHE